MNSSVCLSFIYAEQKRKALWLNGVHFRHSSGLFYLEGYLEDYENRQRDAAYEVRVLRWVHVFSNTYYTGRVAW